MIDLNSKLPNAARTSMFFVVVMLLTVVFFGFVYLHCLALAFTGTRLMKF